MSDTDINPLKRQPHKIGKHIQIIREKQPTNFLSVFYHFVGLARKGLKKQNSGSYLCLAFRDVKSIRV